MKRLAFLLLLSIMACTAREQQSSAPTGQTAPSAEAEQGRHLIARYGCNACHVVPGVAGPQGALGPSLAGIASRPTLSGGTVQNTPANLAQFIQNPASLNAQSTMPPIGLSDEEARAIAAYLATLQ